MWQVDLSSQAMRSAKPIAYTSRVTATDIQEGLGRSHLGCRYGGLVFDDDSEFSARKSQAATWAIGEAAVAVVVVVVRRGVTAEISHR